MAAKPISRSDLVRTSAICDIAHADIRIMKRVM
jgi:hypothetical protein